MGLEKGVDTGKVGEFATRKGGDGLVFDGTGTGETNLESAFDFSIMFCRGNVCVLKEGLR